MEMSSEGPKWWKKGMSQPEIAGKHKNPVTQGGGSRRYFAGLIRSRPALVGREILLPRLSGGGAPPCPEHVQ